MDNNKSTEKRTLMSKEKILKKKDKIHRYKIWVQPTNLYNVMETFFQVDLKRVKYKIFFLKIVFWDLIQYQQCLLTQIFIKIRVP